MEMCELYHNIIGAASKVHSHFEPDFWEEIYKNR